MNESIDRAEKGASDPNVQEIAQLGQPVLRQVAEQVVDPSAPGLQALIDAMLVTMSAADGVGIAAPQLFASLSLFIIASRPNPRYPLAPLMEPTALINPELLWTSAEQEKEWEGCLSIPGLRGLVPRYRRIGVRYLTRSGERREEELSGFVARIFQHEFDHLQGVVFLDRVESTRELVTEREYLRIMTAGGRNGAAR
jgi:peptide deformylase